MLLHNNFEKSTRTSLDYPYAHKDAGTIFIPVDIEETEINIQLEDGTEDTMPGYSFNEYRINEGAKLSDEAVKAVIDAFIQDEEALKTLGLA